MPGFGEKLRVTQQSQASGLRVAWYAPRFEPGPKAFLKQYQLPDLPSHRYCSPGDHSKCSTSPQPACSRMPTSSKAWSFSSPVRRPYAADSLAEHIRLRRRLRIRVSSLGCQARVSMQVSKCPFQAQSSARIIVADLKAHLVSEALAKLRAAGG